jgi:hypothetical protein
MSFAINTDALAKLDAAFDFALQAKQNERAGKSSVIRINGENFSCQVSHADAPRGILSLFSFRKSDQKALNNATRALFKQTVLDAFGVTDENALPQSVKKAMRLSKYDNTGRPLTARRIIAVATAIRNELNAQTVDAAIKSCVKSNEMAIKKHPADPVSKLEVTPRMRKQAISLLTKHASTFTPKARQVLANYAIFTLANCDDAKNIDEIIGTLAKKIAKMDDFKYGDKRFEPLNTKLTEVYQEKLNFYMNPQRADAFKGNISNTLYKDAYRAEFEIKGSDPNAGISPKDVEGRKTAVVSKFKEALPEKFWKPLSMFMCQDMGRITGELLCKRLALYGTGKEVVGTDYKGGELMPFSPNDGEIFDESSALVGQGNDLRYKLEVSEDKKTATITMSANYDLKFCVEGAGYESYNTCGNVQYASQFKFDISGDELKMISCYTSQHIEP